MDLKEQLERFINDDDIAVDAFLRIKLIVERCIAAEQERDQLRQRIETEDKQEPAYILDYEYEDGREDPELGGDLIFHSLNGNEYPVGTKFYALPPTADKEQIR